MSNAHTIIEYWRDGLISTAELVESLESLDVRGDVTGAHYLGYDYRSQRWITSHAAWTDTHTEETP